MYKGTQISYLQSLYIYTKLYGSNILSKLVYFSHRITSNQLSYLYIIYETKKIERMILSLYV